MRDPQYLVWLGSAMAQTLGLMLVVAFAGVWILTGRESVLLVGAAGSLILLGRYERLRIEPSVGDKRYMEARDA